VKIGRGTRGLLAVVMSIGLLAAACSDDDDDSGVEAGGATTASGGATTETTAAATGTAGGELIDLATFPADPPEHIDPALNETVDAYQVINSLYDGLTDIDTTDPANPVVKPLVAEKFEANADATVWTFTIKKGLTFSDGEPVVPTSFQRAWNRAGEPEFAGPYSYLLNFIEGGAERLDGTAETISGIKADDTAMTLEVTMSEPYSNFPAVAGFQLFFPMPSAVEKLTSQNDWENGLMIGNGPFMMEKPRSDTEIVLVRNPKWAGNIYGDKQALLDKITFKVSADVDSAYNAFEAGEGDTATIPAGRFKEADDKWGTTLGTTVISSYHFEINDKDPQVGGAKNLELRRAISLSINRDEINDAIWDGYRKVATSITPPGIPGFKEGLCTEFCSYDPDAAKEHLQAWKDAGNTQTTPVKVLLNAGSGHEDIVNIIVDNMKAVGIDAVSDPRPTETYFTELADGACVLCRSGWTADYPTYDNYMYDLFHTDAIGGNNHGQYSNPEFDALVDEAKSTVDLAKQAELFQSAESILLNDDMAVIPIAWRVGDYAFNDQKVVNLKTSNLELINWEQISLK
jgi:oligopeptide transport system substrate-binding protein